ncbi:MAG: flagellar basal body-associated FliL family protein [Desulfosporosinus sp.]|nr:flagellar basal body-associated FliL family protein [Desulfosporosinus sp.]
MNLKPQMPLILAVLMGALLGVGGTMGVQKFILPASPQSAQAADLNQAKQDGPLVDIGEFTVNLQGGAFLKTTLTVEGTDAKAEAVLKAKSPFLKDKANMVLASKSLVDVQTPAAREKLRVELVKNLNEVADNKIANVLFLSMVYQ